MSASGSICEIFSSIQGEGLLIGRRQVFLRMCGCNLQCAYCDTPLSKHNTQFCRAQEDPDSARFESIPNPVSVETAFRLIQRLSRAGAVQPELSVTGGEPLMQADFLAELLPMLRGVGIEAMLETNGALPDALPKLLPHVSRISMDIKLPSSTGQDAHFDEHARFLELGRQGGVFVKIVISESTEDSELGAALRLVRNADPSIPVVLQPVTARGGVKAPSAQRILELESLASRVVRNIRVIPQAHKIMSVM